ncbi:uncharacterized protein EV422DRAFT_274102 [Fimicolochytrium jonesii]|uniref:uncharacterized protein n=1 Tax=Fimicolochytrium jonesii TaxID=1396493 RepID=UPI0022FF4599|nr:uncharacterized protein EV422DRAFT_274102 [Fimicolochytrium jonesii]KAI8816894.1 hypothetical protein EV422DRAFT_274102 [Fimicolochytrium jonesii]
MNRFYDDSIGFRNGRGGGGGGGPVFPDLYGYGGGGGMMPNPYDEPDFMNQYSPVGLDPGGWGAAGPHMGMAGGQAAYQMGMGYHGGGYPNATIGMSMGMGMEMDMGMNMMAYPPAGVLGTYDGVKVGMGGVGVGYGMNGMRMMGGMIPGGRDYSLGNNARANAAAMRGSAYGPGMGKPMQMRGSTWHDRPNNLNTAAANIGLATHNSGMGNSMAGLGSNSSDTHSRLRVGGFDGQDFLPEPDVSRFDEYKLRWDERTGNGIAKEKTVQGWGPQPEIIFDPLLMWRRTPDPPGVPGVVSCAASEVPLVTIPEDKVIKPENSVAAVPDIKNEMVEQPTVQVEDAVKIKTEPGLPQPKPKQSKSTRPTAAALIDRARERDQFYRDSTRTQSTPHPHVPPAYDEEAVSAMQAYFAAADTGSGVSTPPSTMQDGRVGIDETLMANADRSLSSAPSRHDSTRMDRSGAQRSPNPITTPTTAAAHSNRDTTLTRPRPISHHRDTTLTTIPPHATRSRPSSTLPNPERDRTRSLSPRPSRFTDHDKGTGNTYARNSTRKYRDGDGVLGRSDSERRRRRRSPGMPMDVNAYRLRAIAALAEARERAVGSYHAREDVRIEVDTAERSTVRKSAADCGNANGPVRREEDGFGFEFGEVGAAASLLFRRENRYDA